MWGMFPTEEPSEEEIAAAEAAQEHSAMRAQDMFNRMRRMLAEELTSDQLEVLHNMIIAITNAQHPVILAEWYEGVIAGVRFTRDIRLGETTTEQSEQENPLV